MTYTKGWLQDPIDVRDFDAAEVTPLRAAQEVPTVVDHRKYCSPIENQGALGSCVAQAVAGLVEFEERVKYGRHVDVSRLFLYKVARQLDGFTGDTGAYIRTAMKGLRLFGAPPERYWPYQVETFDRDPSAFAFAYGQNLQAVNYYRLDCANRPRQQVLDITKNLVNIKHPIVFGFRVYSYGNQYGEFPVPKPGDAPKGGHAVLAVGYDDAHRIGDSIGALLIRNSWGTRWGDNGYGWLPYDYVLKGLSSDFWTLMRKETLV